MPAYAFVFSPAPWEAAATLTRVSALFDHLEARGGFGLAYFNGFLLDHMSEDARLLEAGANLVASGRLELLGGGLYSPYLPLLPERDAAWQLSDMAERLEDLFGAEVRGAYLDDGAWKRELSQVLAAEGYRFALLPKAAFARPEPVFSGVLLVPWAPLGQAAPVVCIPGHEKSAEFFKALGQAKAGPFELPGPQTVPIPPVYLEASPEPCPDPRNLPRHDPAAADLFAKMLWVSEKLDEAKRPPESAYRHLYRGQWGPAYREGAARGQRWAWKELLKAENLCDPRKYAWLEIHLEDADEDGLSEVMIESHTLNVYLRPATGGILFALDVRALDLPLLKGRSLHTRFTRDPERIGEAERALLDDLPFEASKYRDRVHLSAAGVLGGVRVELKKTLRIHPKEEALAIEWRVTNLDQKPLEGLLVSDLAVASDALPLTRTQGTALPVQPGLGLRLESNRDFYLWSGADEIRFGFELALPPGKSRRVQLLVQVERAQDAGEPVCPSAS